MIGIELAPDLGSFQNDFEYRRALYEGEISDKPDEFV